MCFAAVSLDLQPHDKYLSQILPEGHDYTAATVEKGC